MHASPKSAAKVKEIHHTIIQQLFSYLRLL
jgi:hypothetical protein